MTSRPSRIKAVILAAGLGTRMKSRTPKVLHPLCGRPMLAYVIDAARAATGEKPLVVYSTSRSSRSPTCSRTRPTLRSRTTPKGGTGDALRAALEALPADVDEVVVTVRRRATDRAGLDERAARRTARERRADGTRRGRARRARRTTAAS